MDSALTTRRWLPSGAIALAAHVAAMVAMHAPPAGGPAQPQAPETSELPFEIALVAEETPTPPESLPAPASERTAVVQRAPAGSGVASRDAEEPTGKAIEGPVEPTAPTAAPPSASGDGWTFNPGKAVDVTSSGFIAQAVRPAPSPEEPAGGPTGVSTSGGLVEGLDARDLSIGLGRGGGMVVSALEAAAAGDAAPFEGRATFDVAIDASGHVSVALLNASSGAAQWARLGQATRASIDPSRLRIPPGARGWHVVADVEAKVQYPNGLDPKKLDTHVEAAGARIVENKERDEAHQPPLLFDKTPGVTLAHAGKVCTVRVTLGLTLTPISGGCDPSNIGARAVRVVHGHVVSEGRM